MRLALEGGRRAEGAISAAPRVARTKPDEPSDRPSPNAEVPLPVDSLAESTVALEEPGVVDDPPAMLADQGGDGGSFGKAI
jgi:hypothetical protein